MGFDVGHISLLVLPEEVQKVDSGDWPKMLIRGSHDSHAILSKNRQQVVGARFGGDGFKIGRHDLTDWTLPSRLIGDDCTKHVRLIHNANRILTVQDHGERCRAAHGAVHLGEWFIRLKDVVFAFSVVASNQVSEITKSVLLEEALIAHPDIVEQTVHVFRRQIAHERHAGFGFGWARHHRSAPPPANPSMNRP